MTKAIIRHELTRLNRLGVDMIHARINTRQKVFKMRLSNYFINPNNERLYINELNRILITAINRN